MFWVSKTAWSTIDFPRRNPACLTGSSGLIMGSIRTWISLSMILYGTDTKQRDWTTDCSVCPLWISRVLESRLQKLFSRLLVFWGGTSRKRGSTLQELLGSSGIDDHLQIYLVQYLGFTWLCILEGGCKLGCRKITKNNDWCCCWCPTAVWHFFRY